MNTSDDQLLRSLDAASGGLNPDQSERADALLARLVATPVVVAEPSYAAKRPAIRRRLAWVAAAFVGLGAGSVALPGLLGGGGMAYASWTATPEKVAARDLDAAVAACRDDLGGIPAKPSEVGLHFDADTIPVVLAERRGDIVSVVFGQDRPEDVTASCLATIRPGSGSVDDTDTGASGSSGAAWQPPADAFAEGAMAGYGDRAWQVSGHAGANVAAVTIHLGATSVVATVKGGRYTAWGPGQAFTNLGQASGEGGPEPLFTYDVTLTDGTVLRGATPARPGN